MERPRSEGIAPEPSRKPDRLVPDGDRTDLQERKRKGIDRTQRCLDGLFAGSRDGFVMIDLEGRILDANPAYCEMLGYSLDELRALKSFHAITPERWHAWQAEEIWAKRLLKTGDSGIYRKEYIRKDGTIFPVELQMHAVRAADGGIAYLWGTARDVGARQRAEEELHRERERLRFVIEGSRLGTWEWNVQTGRTVFNATWAAMLGYTLAELGECNIDTWSRLVHPDDLAVAEAQLQRCFNGEKPDYEAEFRMRHKEGHWVWILDRGRVMTRDPEGKPLLMFGTHTDITGLKRAEEAAREATLRLQESVRAANVGLWEWDIATNAVRFSREWKEQIGYREDEIRDVYEEWRSRVHPDDLPIALAHVERAIREMPARYHTEFRFRHKDGSYRWILSQASVYRNESGQAVRLIGSHIDITALKQREERIALLGQMLDAAPASITIHDTSGRFLFANRQTIRLHGYDNEAEFLAINLHDLDVPESEALLQERFRQIAEKGEARFEVAHYRKDGSTFPLEILAKAIEWHGQPAVLSIATDITERKTLEAQFRQAQKMESIGRLAGGVAHDFNNMLSVILGYTELALARIGTNERVAEYLKQVFAAAQRSAEITRQLLAFARKQTIRPKVLDLNETLVGMLKMLERLIGEDIALEWHPGKSLPPIMMDPSQLHQVLANLCVNARDAISGVGKIVIETGVATFDAEYCEQHAEALPGDFVLLAVSDDGCGMSREVMAKLFEPFFTTKGVGKGTGLGLATVYGIVRQNQGFINVYSEPGQGTTFRIYLPAIAREETQAADPEGTSLDVRGSETVLLVEDEQAILEMTATMLRMNGYTVLAAHTPEQALELARTHAGRIDLLITDVVMPGMNGKDLSERLAALRPPFKCLFMSGYTADAIAHHGVLEKGVQFIHKPFSQKGLLGKVRQTLDARQA